MSQFGKIDEKLGKFNLSLLHVLPNCKFIQKEMLR